MSPSSIVPQFRLPVFEGPLDLLLHLIRENRVDIYDIPIADITSQYLEYLAAWEALDLSIAGEYLVMAATLLEIKSRMLLPQAPPPEGDDDAPDPREELVQRLLEYERYTSAVDTLRAWEQHRASLHFRSALENPEDYLLPLAPGDLSPGQLAAALRRLLAEAGVDQSAVTAVIPKRQVSLRLKMAEILRAVRAKSQGLSFGDLIALPCPRYDIVIAFLAVLELLKSGKIHAFQRKPLGDIRLRLVEETA